MQKYQLIVWKCLCYGSIRELYSELVHHVSVALKCVTCPTGYTSEHFSVLIQRVLNTSICHRRESFKLRG